MAQSGGLEETIRQMVAQEIQKLSQGGAGQGSNTPSTVGQKPLRAAVGRRAGGGAANKGSNLPYDLTQELSQNLTKLREVIRESQQLAQKMEAALGSGGSGAKP